MFIKLTHYATIPKPTIINFDNVLDFYEVFDKSAGVLNTKIVYITGDFINVKEPIQEIFKLIQDHERGIFQSTKWETVPYIDKHIEDTYQRKIVQGNSYHEKNYNRRDPFTG